MTTTPRSPTTSSNPDVQAAFRAAEDRIRHRESTAFGSVRAAVGWWSEARERMQAPNPMHPRTECVDRATGERARIVVDGGRGGDLDETFARIATIGEAIEKGRREEAMGTAALLELVTTKSTQTAIADRQKVAQSTLSVHVARAEKVIAAKLRDAGLL
jgi:hypothetical protein